MNVEINTYEVKNIGQKLLSCSTALEQDIKKLSNIVDTIESSWQGVDATKYVKVMRDINIKELQKVCNMINVYGEYLKQVPEVYTALDAAYSLTSIE